MLVSGLFRGDFVPCSLESLARMRIANKKRGRHSTLALPQRMSARAAVISTIDVKHEAMYCQSKNDEIEFVRLWFPNNPLTTIKLTAAGIP